MNSHLHTVASERASDRHTANHNSVNHNIEDNLIGQESVVLSPTDAQELMQVFPYPRQRHLKKRRVDEYVALMRQGRFYSNSEIKIVYAPDENGKTVGYLINGHHRLTAQVLAGVEMRWRIVHLRADSIEDVNWRYAVEDINIPRTATDRHISRDLPSKYMISIKDTKALESAVNFIRQGFKQSQIRHASPFEKEEDNDQYAGPMRVFLEMIRGGEGRYTYAVRRAPVLSVALATIRDARQVYGHEVLRDFWHGIVTDDALARNDPRKMVVRHIADLAEKRSEAIRPEYTARLVAHCFNHYVTGRTIVNKPKLDISAPINIVGTRWSGTYAKTRTD